MGQCDTAFELGRFALDLVEPCTDDTARGRVRACVVLRLLRTWHVVASP